MANKGAFCISLDFEKYWGVRDVRQTQDIAQEFVAINDVLTQLLKTFDKYNTHVTWAVVGLLVHDTIEELLTASKGMQIGYKDHNLSPFPLSKLNLETMHEDLIIAPQEIKNILQNKNYELASHTYSHYYCLESGQYIEDFKLDLQKMTSIAEKLNIQFKSIVFPRNQVDETCLAACFNEGILVYRGNQPNKYWRNSTYGTEPFIKKLMRVLDAYFPLSKTDTIKIDALKAENERPINLPASRFLRPAQKFNFLDHLKVRRIKKEMRKAAKSGAIYHLWWHPHNFCTFTEENLKQLAEILKYQQALHQEFNFPSLTMSEIAAHVK
ncbi:polysaccharide deacetylase family protein [Crocinitomix catalasitica]|uniref:polysaccharide deacetylase family protein n=1 Tax=Crocinitomix catalasitica TaxID=184607 RepID=UPI0004879A87|nr:polysaccharide deacetylase family protein [Crocinitomix catalasitica]